MSLINYITLHHTHYAHNSDYVSVGINGICTEAGLKLNV